MTVAIETKQFTQIGNFMKSRRFVARVDRKGFSIVSNSCSYTNNTNAHGFDDFFSRLSHAFQVKQEKTLQQDYLQCILSIFVFLCVFLPIRPTHLFIRSSSIVIYMNEYPIRIYDTPGTRISSSERCHGETDQRG